MSIVFFIYAQEELCANFVMNNEWYIVQYSLKISLLSCR